MPLLPLLPLVPLLPLLPLLPLVPEVPDEPDVPLLPLEPELPDVPAEPVDPDEPDVPEVPDVPDVAAANLLLILPVVIFNTNTSFVVSSVGIVFGNPTIIEPLIFKLPVTSCLSDVASPNLFEPDE